MNKDPNPTENDTLDADPTLVQEKGAPPGAGGDSGALPATVFGLGGDTDLDGGSTLLGLREGSVVFNRFELRQRLGQGGMGVVWRVLDQRLNREVALKFLRDELRRDAVAIDDLRRETTKGRKLTHPNIIRILDLEEDLSTAAVSMELIKGESLAKLSLSRPGRAFSMAELGPWIGQLLDALEYAHSQTAEKDILIHRDLKPANIMLTQEGRVKLADFGIACTLRASMSRVSMVAPGSGTLAYMSPQQLAGDIAIEDDYYALGVTLFELVTGKSPYAAGGDIRHQIQHTIPASMAATREVPGDPIPQAWEDVVAALMEKERANRPASIAEIRKGLRGEKFRRVNGGYKRIAVRAKPAGSGVGSQTLARGGTQRGTSASTVQSSLPAPSGTDAAPFPWKAVVLSLAALAVIGGIFLALTQLGGKNENPKEKPDTLQPKLSALAAKKSRLIADQGTLSIPQYRRELQDLISTVDSDPELNLNASSTRTWANGQLDELKEMETEIKDELTHLRNTIEIKEADPRSGAGAKLKIWQAAAKRIRELDEEYPDLRMVEKMLKNVEAKVQEWEAKAAAERAAATEPKTLQEFVVANRFKGREQKVLDEFVGAVRKVFSLPAADPLAGVYRRLMAYQEEEELPVTGRLDDVTIAAMKLDAWTPETKPTVITKTTSSSRPSSAPAPKPRELSGAEKAAMIIQSINGVGVRPGFSGVPFR